MKIKTQEEVTIMKKAGAILGEVLSEVLKNAKPGVTELELDSLASELIIKKGGEAGFKKVHGYKHATCICVNDEVVHGIPGKRILNEGDVVCIDCGVFLDGFHTDMAHTVKIKDQRSKIKDEEEIERFLNIGKKALEESIKVARVGNRIGNVSKTIQNIVEKEGGYSVVRSLVGHGIGRNLHESPEIPGFLKGNIGKTPLIENGMTLAIEVLYNMGKRDVVYEGSDNWTIVTKDGSLSAVFERTVAILVGKPVVVTPLTFAT